MPGLTVETIRRKVADIEANKHDDEYAHGLEDELWELVLSVIATGDCDSPTDLAREALKTRDIKFSRWRA
jgi:hypothetical protein